MNANSFYYAIYFLMSDIQASFLVPANRSLEEAYQALKVWYPGIEIDDLQYGDPEFGYIADPFGTYAAILQQSEDAGYPIDDRLLGLETQWISDWEDQNSGRQIKF